MLTFLQISLNLDRKELQPGGKLAIDINVDCPNSDVALLAVDKGLYILNNENRLSRDKVNNVDAFTTTCLKISFVALSGS